MSAFARWCARRTRRQCFALMWICIIAQALIAYYAATYGR